MKTRRRLTAMSGSTRRLIERIVARKLARPIVSRWHAELIVKHHREGGQGS